MENETSHSNFTFDWRNHRNFSAVSCKRYLVCSDLLLSYLYIQEEKAQPQ